MATTMVLKVGLWNEEWCCDMYKKMIRLNCLKEAANIFSGELSNDVSNHNRCFSSAKGRNKSTTISWNTLLCKSVSLVMLHNNIN
jgi:hypothetical protein